MRLRARHALFLTFLGLIAFLVTGVVIVGGRGLRSELVERYREELRRELGVAAAAVEALDVAPPDSIAGALARRLGHRVTIIEPAGTVLGDSDVPRERLGMVGSHAGRPEVREALAEGLGFAERLSRTVGVRLLYAAGRAELDGRPIILRIAASLREVDATVARARKAVITAGILAIAVALALTYLLSHALTRPIEELSRRARALAAGAFGERAPRGSRVVELDRLAAAFNDLADQLEGRLDELAGERDEMETLIDCMAEGVVALDDSGTVVRTNRAARRFLGLDRSAGGRHVGTVVRHPALRRVLEAAPGHPVEAREMEIQGRRIVVSTRPLESGGVVVTLLDVTEVRRLEQVRRDFVANASHELKTPLTSMRGFAETLLEDDPPGTVREEFLRRIRSNTLRMQALVDDLLDLSHLESGEWEPDPAEVDPVAVAREAWGELGERPEPGGVEFEARGRGLARADPGALAQILRNLLDNAVRHTDAGTITVEVRERPEEGVIEVAVRDTGSGIPESALSRIFERFYRLDPGRSRAEGGTGLGLSIVRHLVRRMGGEIGAESELGKGTTIRFTLPAAPAGEGAAAGG